MDFQCCDMLGSTDLPEKTFFYYHAPKGYVNKDLCPFMKKENIKHGVSFNNFISNNQNRMNNNLNRSSSENQNDPFHTEHLIKSSRTIPINLYDSTSDCSSPFRSFTSEIENYQGEQKRIFHSRQSSSSRCSDEQSQNSIDIAIRHDPSISEKYNEQMENINHKENYSTESSGNKVHKTKYTVNSIFNIKEDEQYIPRIDITIEEEYFYKAKEILEHPSFVTPNNCFIEMPYINLPLGWNCLDLLCPVKEINLQTTHNLFLLIFTEAGLRGADINTLLSIPKDPFTNLTVDLFSIVISIFPDIWRIAWIILNSIEHKFEESQKLLKQLQISYQSTNSNSSAIASAQISDSKLATLLGYRATSNEVSWINEYPHHYFPKLSFSIALKLAFSASYTFLMKLGYINMQANIEKNINKTRASV